MTAILFLLALNNLTVIVGLVSFLNKVLSFFLMQTENHNGFISFGLVLFEFLFGLVFFEFLFGLV